MNIQEMRNMLGEQMLLLRAGKSDPKNVNAMVNAAGKLIASVRLEMDLAKLIGGVPAVGFITQLPAPKLKAVPKKARRR